MKSACVHGRTGSALADVHSARCSSYRFRDPREVLTCPRAFHADLLGILHPSRKFWRIRNVDVLTAYECCLHGTRGATRQPPLDGRRRHNEPPEPAARASAHLHAERGLRRPHRPRRRSHMEEPHVHLHGAQLQPHPAALCMPPCTSPCTPPCTSSAAPEPRALEHHTPPSAAPAAAARAVKRHAELRHGAQAGPGRGDLVRARLTVRVTVTVTVTVRVTVRVRVS